MLFNMDRDRNIETLGKKLSIFCRTHIAVGHRIQGGRPGPLRLPSAAARAWYDVTYGMLWTKVILTVSIQPLFKKKKTLITLNWAKCLVQEIVLHCFNTMVYCIAAAAMHNCGSTAAALLLNRKHIIVVSLVQVQHCWNSVATRLPAIPPSFDLSLAEPFQNEVTSNSSTIWS